jgi:hypothetical protein
MGLFYADQDSIAPRPCATQSPNFPPNPGPVAEGILAGFGQLATDVIPIAFNGRAPTGGSGPTEYYVTSGDLYDHTADFPQQAYPTGEVRPVVEGALYGSGEIPILRLIAPVSSPAPDPTTTTFTINGGTTEVGLIGLPHNVALAAIVTFENAPAADGETVQWWAQNQSGGDAFQFGTSGALTSLGGGQYSAQSATFSVTDPPFTTFATFNVWAVFAGDANNDPSTSNTVVLNITSS